MTFSPGLAAERLPWEPLYWFIVQPQRGCASALNHKVGFQDEFRALLRRHRIEWDERYVWD
jgi:hypothetical protein